METNIQKWHVTEEMVKRSKFLRLSILDTETGRIIAVLPGVLLGDEEKVAALREEARLVALAPELAYILERYVYAAETKMEPKYSDGKLYRWAKIAAYNLLDRVKGLK